MGVQVSLLCADFDSFGDIPKSGMAGSYQNSAFNLFCFFVFFFFGSIGV
jgi:hypothetical protein